MVDFENATIDNIYAGKLEKRQASERSQAHPNNCFNLDYRGNEEGTHKKREKTLCKRRSLFTMSEFIRRNFVVHSKSFWMCAMLKQKYKHNLLDLSPRLIAMHNVCPISGLYTDQSECERFIILPTFCHESLRFFDNFFLYILFFYPNGSVGW